jgi:hypothetical protein
VVTTEKKPQSVTLFRLVQVRVGVSRIEKKRPGGKKGGFAGEVENERSLVGGGLGLKSFLALCQIAIAVGVVVKENSLTNRSTRPPKLRSIGTGVAGQVGLSLRQAVPVVSLLH